MTEPSDAREFLPGDLVQNIGTGVIAEVVSVTENHLVFADDEGRFAVDPSRYVLFRRSA